MEFVDKLAALVEAKQLELNHRGLMSFPVDSDEDQDNWSLLERAIGLLNGVEIMSSPTTPLKLPVDADFPARMLYYFLVGDYEEHDMRLITKHVNAGARVLELGGGVGLTGSLLGLVSGNLVTICEPNPTLYPYIERTFAANGVELNLIRAAAVADAHQADSVTFHVSPEYWWSSVIPADGAEQITCPAIHISQLIADSQADTLVVDVEGYECDLLSDVNALAQIQTMLIEIHTPSVGSTATCDLITRLVKVGFSLVDMGGHTFVFKR